MNISRFLFKYAGGWALLLATVTILLVAVQEIPEWQAKRASVRSTAFLPEAATTPVQIAGLQNEMRKTFVQVLGGVFAVLALWFTYRRTKVTEQGHITDRYTKAIEQLGAIKIVNGATIPNVEVRLGAIYALERIALDSPRDHWTIMEVLTAYVRENAPLPTIEASSKSNFEPYRMQTNEGEANKPIAKGPATEIQAILTVLGRRKRDWKRERIGRSLDLTKCDLNGADFRGTHFERADFGGTHGESAKFSNAYLDKAQFLNAHLEGAIFGDAHIVGALFIDARLERTNFGGAYAEGADFTDAILEEAYFFGAHAKRTTFHRAQLKKTNFSSADLENAKFYDAHLEKANFSSAGVEGAGFHKTNGLTSQQIGKANGWEKAILSVHLARELGLVRPEYSTSTNIGYSAPYDSDTLK
jgi:uncharacterized protein YjbI with pentapeptide repeats